MANSVYFTLKDEGVKKTDVIGLLMPNCMEYVAFWLGAAKIVKVAKFYDDFRKLKSEIFSCHSYSSVTRAN